MKRRNQKLRMEQTKSMEEFAVRCIIKTWAEDCTKDWEKRLKMLVSYTPGINERQMVNRGRI